MCRYPFLQFAVLASGLSLTFGCDSEGLPTQGFEQSSESVHEATDYRSANEDGLTPSGLLDVHAPLSLFTDFSTFEVVNPKAKADRFAISARPAGELPYQDALDSPCQLEYLSIDRLANALPVDVTWVGDQEPAYELLIDIYGSEQLEHLGTIVQTHTDFYTIDISDRIQSGQDYLAEAELTNVDRDEHCIGTGVIRFDPVNEL